MSACAEGTEESPIGDYIVSYSSDGDTLIIRNTREVDKLDVTAFKIWDDANDQDGMRPVSVKFQLKANGENKGRPVTLTQGSLENGIWSYTWEDMLVNSEGGHPVTYTVEETSSVEGYTKSSSTDGLTITNKHEPLSQELNVEWEWDDDGNRDGIRPDSAVISVYLGDVYYGDVTVNGNDTWSGTITVPKNVPGQSGIRAIYSLREKELDERYTAAQQETGDPDRVKMIGSYTPELTSVSVSKDWDDSDNRDGKRMPSINYALVRDGVTDEDFVTVNAVDSENYEYEFTGLYKYRDAGQKIVYEVSELDPGDYTPDYQCSEADDGSTVCRITNRKETETFDLPVQWTWVDEDNRDGMRQDTVTVNIFMGNEQVGTVTFDKTENVQIKNVSVPAYTPGEVGVEAVYTYVIQDLDDTYESAINDSNTRKPLITATYEPEKVSVRASKTWNDNDNQDGQRPTSVKYVLMSDRDEVETVTVSEETSATFSYVWSDLYKYHDQGIEYNYSVVEQDYGDYTPSYNCSERSYGVNCVVTNYRDTEMKDLNIRWNWDDDDNRDGKRQHSVTVEIYLDNDLVDTVYFYGQNDTETVTITVPAYTPGEEGVPCEFTYVIKDLSADYVDSLDETDPDNPVITAKHEAEKVSVSVSKIWDDSDNQDGIRYDSVSWALTVDGTRQDPVTVTKEQSADFAYDWDDLYKYHDGGRVYRYAVEEIPVDNYTPTSNCEETEDGIVCVITNFHEAGTKDLEIKWKWDDDGDRDGKRPECAVVDVYLDGEYIDTVEFCGPNDESTKTITVPANTPGSEGVPSQFTYVVHDMPEGYTSGIDDSDTNKPVITGTYEVSKVSVTAEKIWDDSDNQDGKRPDTITWQLTRDGGAADDPVTVDTGNETHRWDNLFLYHDHGLQYEYAVQEVNIGEGYTSSVECQEEEAVISCSVTNVRDPEKFSATPKIVWDDDEDRDGMRPETVKIRIIADDVATEYTVDLSNEEDWMHLFENLPRYANGHEINYAFEIIDHVNGYSYRFNPEDEWIVTLTHHPERREFSAIVKWIDDDNADRVRPGAVSLQLYADGIPEGSPKTVVSPLTANSTASIHMFRPKAKTDIYELSENEDWSAEWDDLLVNKDSEAIVYTVRQLNDLTPDYLTDHKDHDNCTVITNIHDREVMDVEYIVMWDDVGNLAGKRPNELEVVIYKNADEVVDFDKIPTDNDEYEGKFTNIIVYENGLPVAYRVEPRNVPEDYVVSITQSHDGTYLITLKYIPKDLVKKAIFDENGNDWSGKTCKRWDIVTIRLTVHNGGQNTLYNVRVRDRIPQDATFIADSESMTNFDEEAGDYLKISQGRIDANIKKIEPDETIVISYKAQANDPMTFADIAALYDFGNPAPLPVTSPDPEQKTNTVEPCRLEGRPEEPVSRPTELPKTGFAPNVYTKLPPASVNYQAYSQLRIRIPKIGIDAEILGVPYENGNWDVSWLGENIGWLQNTAYPGSTGAGNTVLTGHLTNNYGLPGVFANLEKLSYGDEIIITAFGETFTYIVDDTMTVYQDTPQLLSQKTDLPILTLITCKYFNSSTGLYEGRFAVTAKLSGIS
ncbi:MAG: sortase [Anaerolineaceae bacterium]|nr:sortase [Anaerolineaceae bacterium]